jgi:hypothetical protein
MATVELEQGYLRPSESTVDSGCLLSENVTDDLYFFRKWVLDRGCHLAGQNALFDFNSDCVENSSAKTVRRQGKVGTKKGAHERDSLPEIPGMLETRLLT